MLDQMSRGRLQVGLGRGAVWIEQKIYDIDPDTVPERYREEWDKLGRKASELPVLGLNRHIVVADTDAEALKVAGPAYLKWRNSFSWLWDQKGVPFPFPYPETLEAHMAAGFSIVGSPATVRDALAADTAAAGANGVLGHMIFGSIAYEDALRSLELFAAEVMPGLKQAG